MKKESFDIYKVDEIYRKMSKEDKRFFDLHFGYFNFGYIINFIVIATIILFIIILFLMVAAKLVNLEHWRATGLFFCCLILYWFLILICCVGPRYVMESWMKKKGYIK